MFVCKAPKEVYAGQGALTQLPALVKGAARAAVFSDKGIEKAGLLAKPLQLLKEAGVCCTLLTELARSMVKSYFVGRHILRDFDEMVETVTVCHQGAFSKALIRAIGDIRRKYIAFCQQYGLPPEPECK